jgi:hypothetical protein
MARTGLRMMPTSPSSPLKVGSRVGAVLQRSDLSVGSPFPLGVPHEPNRKPVSNPRRVTPSMPISSTRRSWSLRPKGYETHRAGTAVTT